MSSIIIFGAGNIGRSFIGNIFASNGWEVTFIDADEALVQALNSRGSYPVIIKQNNQPDEKIEVKGINALHSTETGAILKVLSSCSLCATSVGQGALRFVVPQIAEAVKARAEADLPPLDVIIAENIRGGAEHFRKIFNKSGLKGNEAGLVETSIGKMVPIMTEDDLADDRLLLHAEEYNTLILDAEGFKNPVPELPQIKAVNNIKAWVDRKLFIHNLGHAATAYFGFSSYPQRRLIAEVITEPEIEKKARRAMKQSAAALLAEYPDDFTAKALEQHIDDLIFRFANSALGDTIFRVGRDLRRKLDRNDRVLGAAALCLQHGLPCDGIIDVFRAALNFKAVDVDGKMFERDKEFHRKLETCGVNQMLSEELKVVGQEVVKLICRY